MKLIFKILFFYFFGILSSCFQKHKETISYNIEKIEEIKFSSIFSNVETIILETTHESIIGEVSSIKYSDEYLYVLDKNKSNSIFIFDLKGNFISKIKGGYTGPSSLNYPDNLEIVEDDLLVYDSRQNKVLRYSLDGVFQEENYLKNKEIYSLDMLSNGSNLLFFDFYSDPSSLFRIFDLNGNLIVEQEFGEKDYKVISGRRRPYLSFSNQNEIRVQIPGSDCFYHYNNSGQLEKVCFDLDSEKLFNSNSMVEFYDYYSKVQNQNATILRGEIVDLVNYSLFSVQRGNSIILSIWNKSNNEANAVKLINDGASLCPDIEMLPTYNVTPSEMSLNFFPGDLKMIFLNSKKNEALLRFFEQNNIEEIDNPIVFRLIE